MKTARVVALILLLSPGLRAQPAGTGEGGFPAEMRKLGDVVPLNVSPEMPYVIGSVQKGERKTYRLPIQNSALRHTATLQPVTGDVDLKVWLTDALDKAPDAQSQEGPLMTDRVSLTPKALAGRTALTLDVVGRTAGQYLLWVTTTGFHLTSPSRVAGGALRLKVLELFGDADVLLAHVEVTNQSGAWYELSLKPQGEALKKSSPPLRSMLGPQQTVTLSWLPFVADSSLKVSVDRTSKTALIYVACDMTARLVNGGSGLPNSLPKDLNLLVPQLQPLAAVGELFAKGAALQGAARLVAIAKTDPKTFTALHKFLQKSGIGLSQSVLSGKILSGLGPIAAVIQGLSTLKAPEKESLTVAAQPYSQ
ncbi:MAG: hypothetical protein HY318_15960 [Armatimonadetes bacterium]|nr:hypothetical protein [Armatimonadota bacterium]